jgi:hypothetical protein
MERENERGRPKSGEALYLNLGLSSIRSTGAQMHFTGLLSGTREPGSPLPSLSSYSVVRYEEPCI